MNKKILLTGANGFLGKHIYREMHLMNDVLTLSRSGADLNFDLTSNIPILPTVDLVIHCAGKAHIAPKTVKEKQAFFDVNVEGTRHLLKGLESSSGLPRSFVFISSIAVYGCDSGALINEQHPLNAQDPYGLSKIQAEKLVAEWCLRNDVVCAILRLPLLVGECPPGNLGAMIKAIKKGYYLNIAGGSAKKSMVMAEDVAKLTVRVARAGGIFNLTDGCHPSFYELSTLIAQQLKKDNLLNIPTWLAKILAKLGDLAGAKFPFNSYKLKKITSDLTFDDSKAARELAWKPKSVLTQFRASTTFYT